MKIIREFVNEYAFLSNYEPCYVTYQGATYLSAEAAYHSAKFKSKKDKALFEFLSADASKQLAKKMKDKIRLDWNLVKEQIMYNIVYKKFTQNSELRMKLIDTRDDFLIEGNYWEDHFWGVCPKEGNIPEDGQNILGQILMKVRAELKYKEAQNNG